MKKLLRKMIENQKRSASAGGASYFSRAFLPNPFVPLENYELHMMTVFKSVLDLKEGAVIDVGANIGQTLNSILRLAPDRPYVGFEPQAYACSVIEIFIIENKLKDKIVLPIGLSNESGVVGFDSFGLDFATFYNTGATTVSSFAEVQTLPVAKRHIIVERGDDIFRSLKIEDMALLKIDVEGAELAVLQGSEQTIKDMRPFITLEILPPHLRGGTPKDFHEEGDEMLAWLRQRDLHLYQIDRDGRVKKVSDRLDEKVRTRDYIAVPGELEASWRSHHPLSE